MSVCILSIQSCAHFIICDIYCKFKKCNFWWRGELVNLIVECTVSNIGWILLGSSYHVAISEYNDQWTFSIIWICTHQMLKILTGGGVISFLFFFNFFFWARNPLRDFAKRPGGILVQMQKALEDMCKNPLWGNSSQINRAVFAKIPPRDFLREFQINAYAKALCELIFVAKPLRDFHETPSAGFLQTFMSKKVKTVVF